MPELGEVEWFRRQWNPGIGAKVISVSIHPEKRIFRGINTAKMRACLVGSKLIGSEARGKRMFFRFSKDNWLGIHLGMTGNLRVEKGSFVPAKHDHLVLHLKDKALVLRDSRLFGRVRFHHDRTAPDWWNDGVPEIVSADFGFTFFAQFLKRHRRAPIKAVLLRQEGFSGVGNWMADEILWRAHVHPSRTADDLGDRELRIVWRETRLVARKALEILGADDSHLPRTWLIHERWSRSGVCPKHRVPLLRATIGGRTTAWCSRCQPEKVAHASRLRIR